MLQAQEQRAVGPATVKEVATPLSAASLAEI